MALWSAIPILGQILDKVLPDRSKVNEALSPINESEVSGAPASILRLWRGFIGWILGFSFAWEVIVRPVITTYWPNATLPPPALEEVSRLLLALLGMGW